MWSLTGFPLPQSCPRHCTKTNLWNASCALFSLEPFEWSLSTNQVSAVLSPDLSRSSRRTRTRLRSERPAFSSSRQRRRQNSRSTGGCGACTALLDDSSSLNIHWKRCSVSEQFRFWISKKTTTTTTTTTTKHPCLPEAQTSRAQEPIRVRIHSWCGDFNKYQMGAATSLDSGLWMVIRTTSGPLQVQFECLYWSPPMCYFVLKSPVTLFDPGPPADCLIDSFKGSVGSSQHRGLRLQDGLRSRVAVKLHHVLRPVPGGEGAVVVAVSAQAAVQTHTPPLPLQLALNLQHDINRYIRQEVKLQLMKGQTDLNKTSWWNGPNVSGLSV